MASWPQYELTRLMRAHKGVLRPHAAFPLGKSLWEVVVIAAILMIIWGQVIFTEKKLATLIFIFFKNFLTLINIILP